MSNDCGFQTRSFPSRVPKGTRRFLMRRTAVYYSKNGIYPDVRLISSTRITILIKNTKCDKNPTRKYSGAGIKQNNHNILWAQNMQNPLGGWMSKIKIAITVLHTPHSKMRSGAGDINKHHNSTYNPTRICSGDPNYNT